MPLSTEDTPVPESAPADRPVPESAAAPAPPDPAICPRCGGKLTNPDGLGWCSGCGFCRSLEEEGQAVVPAEPAPRRKPSALGASEFGEAMRRMPRWAWPLLAGTALVAGASAVGDYLLPEDCLARALWSAIQMVLSIVGLIAAQLWAMLLVGAHEEGLAAKDVILPGRLWRAALRHLPTTRQPVWLGAWCLTGLVCGAAVIGGFEYWLEALQARRLRQVADALALEFDPAVRDTAREAPTPEPSVVPVPAFADQRPVAQCVVVGYQTDGTNVTGLILARADGDRLKFAGVVQEGISPALRKELLGRLSRLVREESLIPGLKIKGALWVKPGVFCDVTHGGVDKQGQLDQPALKELKD